MSKADELREIAADLITQANRLGAALTAAGQSVNAFLDIYNPIEPNQHKEFHNECTCGRCDPLRQKEVTPPSEIVRVLLHLEDILKSPRIKSMRDSIVNW